MIQAALLAFVFLIPLETLGHESETSSLTVSRLVGMALAGSCLFRPRLLLRWPDRLTIWGFALMTVALGQTSFVDADQFGYAFGRYTTWLQMLVFYHVARPLMAHPGLRQWSLYAYVAGAAVTAVFLLRGSGLNVAMLEKGRTALGNLDPNVQAAVLGLAALWLLAMLLHQPLSIRRPLAWLGWPTVALLVSASLLTGSRGGLLALCVGLVSLPVVGGGLGRPLRALALVFLGLGLMALVVAQNELLMNRILHSVEDGDTAGRDYLFASSLDLIKHRPLLGWGLGSNEAALGGYTNTVLRDMHSIYLYALTAGGAVGGFLLGGLLWAAVHAARQLPAGHHRQVALVGLVFVLTFGGTVTILFFKFFWVALVMATPTDVPALRA